MVRARTFSSYNPRRRRDQNADRRQLIEVQLATFSATATRLLWRAPSIAKVTRVSLLSESTVPGLNQSYWSFQIYNRTRGSLTLFADAPTTQNSEGNNPKGAITADTEFDLGTLQNVYLAANDVLELVATKTGSASNITTPTLILEYEVQQGENLGGTTTSTSTTTTTTTTTTTSTTTTTTSSSTTVTTTSSSTTTTSSSTTTTSSSTTTTTTTTTTISTSTTVT